MRWICLSLLIACGAPAGGRPAHGPGPAKPATATAAAGAATAAAGAATALPTFARAGELFMVLVDGKAARCEGWTIDPERSVMISKQGPRELAFQVSGKTLELTQLTRFRGDEEEASGTCDLRLAARETEQAIVLEGAKLFRTAEACAAAVKGHERVALRLECGIDGEQTPPRAQRATRAKLEALLGGGGALHTIVEGPSGETCRSVRVRAHRSRERGSLEGTLEHEVVRDDGVKGTTAYNYVMTRGDTKITFLGPGTTWRDGSGQAFG